MSVYVAIFEHKHGVDVSVHATMAGAERWRQEIADDYWHDAFGPDHEKPADRETMTRDYWDTMGANGEEWFSIEKCDIAE